MLRYSEDSFDCHQFSTIGVDFKIKTIKVNNKVVKMQIWDTAGQERFRTITNSYYKGAHAILCVYDCTDRKSFENIQHWMQEIDKYAKDNVVKVIIANKIDREDRVVSSDEGKKLVSNLNHLYKSKISSDAYKVHYFEASAKTGEKVENLFAFCAEKILYAQKIAVEEKDENAKILEHPELALPRKRKSRWCRWLLDSF
ncbi:unnamed protein product [Moneuplotes crassus]|uniref:Uncharacterized protein n=1 Tax=Euplotes crassus TaxID=5936 RepID=A0AAD1XPH4_EUPCR|nr:unnamed protein product [Moneuplotes crassus]